MIMDAQLFWQLFMKTGSPEVYLMFNEARRAEEVNVFDNSGVGAESNTVQ